MLRVLSERGTLVARRLRNGFLPFHVKCKGGSVPTLPSLESLPRCTTKLHAIESQTIDAGRYYAAEPIVVDELMSPEDLGKDRILIVDALDPINRVHHAYKDRLTSAKGEDTTILFGFLNHLLRLFEMSPPPTHCIIAFDAPGKTFRHVMSVRNVVTDDPDEFISNMFAKNQSFEKWDEYDFRDAIFPAYKANRDPTPDEIREAIPKIKELLEALGITWLAVHSVEADDVIGTLAQRAAQEGRIAYIASRDKDFFQVLQPNVRICRGPMKDKKFKIYTEDTFRDEFDNLEPLQWIDVLALMGDPADNVPGVKGIGPKRAQKLVKEFGDVEGILASLEEVTPKSAKEALMTEEGQNAARHSRKLVEIHRKLNLPPLRVDFDKCKLMEPEDGGEAAMALLESYEIERPKLGLQKCWKSWKS